MRNRDSSAEGRWSVSPHQKVLSKPTLAGPSTPGADIASGFTSHREQSPKAAVITFFLIKLTRALLATFWPSCYILATISSHCYKELRVAETKSCVQAHTASSAKKGASNWPLSLEKKRAGGGQALSPSTSLRHTKTHCLLP